MIATKICGITNDLDAKLAISMGASALGFIFYKKSPRYIDIKAAKMITRNNYNSKFIGVFVDEDSEYIKKVIEEVELHGIQLHGNESSQRCSDIKKLFDLPVIKAFGINSALDLNAAAHYENVVDYFLFDAKPDIKNIKQKGGLNKVFNWKILDNWKGKEFFLAGGININNIKSAINDTNAFCIDISSGVEKALGIKDSNMIKEIYTEFKALL